MDNYLKEEYNVFEDVKYLTEESSIENYFNDNGPELFDCGQGYCEESISIICKVKDKFYEVEIVAEIGAQRMDRGDDLYFVDYISEVSYKEIDKPLPKPRKEVQYNLMITDHQKSILENFMKYEHIEFN